VAPVLILGVDWLLSGKPGGRVGVETCQSLGTAIDQRTFVTQGLAGVIGTQQRAEMIRGFFTL